MEGMIVAEVLMSSSHYQCILIARIITKTSMVLKKYYTKTQIIFRRQSYSKNVSRMAAGAGGIEAGDWGSGVGVASRRTTGVVKSGWCRPEQQRRGSWGW
jgi:hypothetical protein